MIELGKYVGTVLSAYGFSLALLAAIIVQSVRANARARRELQEYERRG